MSDRLRVAAIGVVIDIEIADRGEAFLDRVRAAWADAATSSEGEPEAVVADRSELDDDAALAMLSTDVTLAALAARRGADLWMLHAAGLADHDGNVVVLSAASGTGKTTAARHLSRRFAYVSDETVAITAHGEVVPYRKPLSVIQPDSPHKLQVAPSAIHASHPLPARPRVARIVVLDRRPDGPEAPEVEPLDTATALELLAPQTSYLSDAPAPLHLVRHLLDATGGAVRVSYREVETLDATIDELLATPKVGDAARPRTQATSSAEGLEETVVSEAIRGYQRTPVVDALDLGDGRLAVLRRCAAGSRLHVLDGIGPSVWAAAPGRTIDEITDEVIAEHGRPDGADPAELVDAAVAQLIADDLLRAAEPQT
ncbi:MULTISPECIES: hypothetical protein [unclassified Microbacterium]|uniref:hypothetical protein n=1 Tax=unclassified Microbacterium TaxID=2609290 RepID=UPI00160536F6|nr:MULTISPECIES: hypothetical protein [unclassified Microbacterium]QNA92001.1 hypothetical protein G4G29_05325 [Microbacterium sp. Se63.02b]QYM65232.1 ATP-binding protein [Microbacterium sp. Se5.02b]